jgi:hypothetical protein
MSEHQIRVGVACPIPGERAAFLEWLKLAEYEPVPMLDIDSIGRDMGARPIEVLIADVSLVPKATLPRLLKALGANRPLVLVGSPDQSIEDVPRDATFIARPVTRENFTMSIALALAEGRPARRSPRRLVPKLLSSVDGVASKIVDVSSEGVRLEINAASPSILPPYFTLRVPGFGVNTKVKRVWVTTPQRGLTWCGGIIEKKASSEIVWNKFLQNAPAGGQRIAIV